MAKYGLGSGGPADIASADKYDLQPISPQIAAPGGDVAGLPRYSLA
jgi:hypothetical protein